MQKRRRRNGHQIHSCWQQLFRKMPTLDASHLRLFRGDFECSHGAAARLGREPAAARTRSSLLCREVGLGADLSFAHGLQGADNVRNPDVVRIFSLADGSLVKASACAWRDTVELVDHRQDQFGQDETS